MKILLFIGIVCMMFSCDRYPDDSHNEEEPRYGVEEEVDPSNFYGKWYAKNEIDSTVVFFEPLALTVYIYERKTEKLIDRSGFGSWRIIHRYIIKSDTHRYLLKFQNDNEYYWIEYNDKYTIFTFVDLNEFSGLTVTRIKEE